MPTNQILKLMINERLSEAAEGIFALFEQTIAEYQREIVRLKAKRGESAPDPQCCSEVPLQTRTAGHMNEENDIPFVCKEETEQLMITEEHVHITNVKTIDDGQESQPLKVKSEGPEASGGAETDSFEPTSESEEEVSDPDSDAFGSDAPQKPFSCSVCRRRFSQKRGLKMHMRKAHASETPLPSAECLSQLDREHSQDRPFSCSVCKREFKLRFTLEAHMRNHSGGDPFYCLVCVASFPNHIDFTGHIKTVHSSENPFKCSVCYRSLKNVRNYTSHMQLHTGERPYSCPVCGRGFLQKGNLKYHMFTHTGEKPFSCSECGVRYTSKQNLLHHKKMNH